MPAVNPMNLPLPDQAELAELVTYNRDTGDVHALVHLPGVRAGKPCDQSVHRTPPDLKVLAYHKQHPYTVFYVWVPVLRLARTSSGLYMRSHVVWKLVTGDEPLHIEHLDGNPFNLRFDNLKLVDAWVHSTHAAEWERWDTLPRRDNT